jgi:hypothetical protein
MSELFWGQNKYDMIKHVVSIWGKVSIRSACVSFWFKAGEVEFDASEYESNV